LAALPKSLLVRASSHRFFAWIPPSRFSGAAERP
jgi:hypothetical protein